MLESWKLLSVEVTLPERWAEMLQVESIRPVMSHTN